MSRFLPALAIALILAAPMAHGQALVLPQPNLQGPDLGRVAQAPGASSVWRIDPDTGDVTLVSGEAVRLTTGPSTPPMITIDCLDIRCRGATVVATFAPSAAGQATILGLTPGTVTGRGLTLATVSGAGTTRLMMTFVGGAQVPARATFPLGMTVRLSPGCGAASPNYGYTMLVTLH